MPSVLLFFIFNICFLFNQIRTENENSILQLNVYPLSGYTAENIDVYCHIRQPSIYDNVYLSVLTDNVKPSGILIMVDDTMNDCRKIENKEKYFRILTCNSTLIHVNINHEIINDSLHTIQYRCTQGETNVFNTYRILRRHMPNYHDGKSANSSLILAPGFSLLILFLLPLITNRKFR